MGLLLKSIRKVKLLHGQVFFDKNHGNQERIVE